MPVSQSPAVGLAGGYAANDDENERHSLKSRSRSCQQRSRSCRKSEFLVVVNVPVNFRLTAADFFSAFKSFILAMVCADMEEANNAITAKETIFLIKNGFKGY